MRHSSLKPEDLVACIHQVRHRRVMLDADLATLYGISTGALVQAVSRNRSRFPEDFMFLLTDQELAHLKSQSVISSVSGFRRWGGRRKPYHAFTEQGVAMLASVLRSDRAIAVSIAVVRAFVRLRYMVAANAELAAKLDELERRVSDHDESIADIVRAIRELATPPARGSMRQIGFISGE